MLFQSLSYGDVGPPRFANTSPPTRFSGWPVAGFVVVVSCDWSGFCDVVSKSLTVRSSWTVTAGWKSQRRPRFSVARDVSFQSSWR
jgi:hypothetical protein